MPLKWGSPEHRIVWLSNVRFDERGLITKLFPDKDDNKDDISLPDSN